MQYPATPNLRRLCRVSFPGVASSPVSFPPSRPREDSYVWGCCSVETRWIRPISAIGSLVRAACRIVPCVAPPVYPTINQPTNPFSPGPNIFTLSLLLYSALLSSPRVTSAFSLLAGNAGTRAIVPRENFRFPFYPPFLCSQNRR